MSVSSAYFIIHVVCWISGPVTVWSVRIDSEQKRRQHTSLRGTDVGGDGIRERVIDAHLLFTVPQVVQGSLAEVC